MDMDFGIGTRCGEGTATQVLEVPMLTIEQRRSDRETARIAHREMAELRAVSKRRSPTLRGVAVNLGIIIEQLHADHGGDPDPFEKAVHEGLMAIYRDLVAIANRS